jgi:hypothetical protein
MPGVVATGIRSAIEKIKKKIRMGLIFMVYFCIIARLGQEKVNPVRNI